MPSFGTVALPDINPLFDLASVDRNVNTINAGRLANQLASSTLDSNTQIAANAAEHGGLANQLASNTLGSNTQIAANAAEGGALANQQAAVMNPLDAIGKRQLLGIDPSPTLDRLQNMYGGTPIGGFDHAMAGRESSNDPTAVNAGGYAGTYQFGAPRLAAIGAYTPAPGEIDADGKWNGQMAGQFHIAGHPEVKTLQDFLHDPTAQTDAFKAHVAGIDAAITQTPGADKFDPNGLRAVAHLGGIEGMQKFVSTGGAYNPADSNGTHLSDYYKRFAAGGVPALVSAFGPPQAPAQAPAQPGVALAPNGVAPPATGPQMASTTPILSQPDAAPAPGTQGIGPVMAQLRAGQAAPQVQNPNSLLPLASSDGSVPDAPQNALAPPALAAAPPQPAPAPAAQPGTGMNSPQVQQAQALVQRAAQIEMAAAQTPNDPRAKATAAAMASDLRARAAVLMQADSVTVDPVTGLQTHTLTGKQDSAAQPVHNPARVTKVEGPGGTILTQPGSPDRIIPYGGRPEQTDAYKADIPEAQNLTAAAQTAQSNMPRLNEMADLIHQVKSGGLAPELRAKISSSLQAAGFDPDSVAKLPGLSNGSAAELFKKLSISTAGGEAKANVGSNNGIQSTQLYLSANPGLNLLPDANMRVTNMLRVASQMTQDYAQSALAHFGKNEAEFLGNNSDNKAGNYVPLTTFNRQWQAQSNPQVGAAAIGILNGDPFDKWSARITPAEAARAAQIVAHIDPIATVALKGGGMRPVSDILSHPSIAPAAP